MEETDRLPMTLQAMKDEGKISLAILFGSFAKGCQHARLHIDIAVHLNAADLQEQIEMIDRIYGVSRRVLHECETIRFRREISLGWIGSSSRLHE